jgi:hypothetical protein
MRTFRYIEPAFDRDPFAPLEPWIVTRTEGQILAGYFNYWAKGMERVGKAHLISHENCLEDWIVVHWAEEVK